jgi:hypothetical protein
MWQHYLCPCAVFTKTSEGFAPAYLAGIRHDLSQTTEIETLAEDLAQYHAEFADLYYRVEPAHWGEKYLQGLLLPIERKSIEPLALALAGAMSRLCNNSLGKTLGKQTCKIPGGTS